MGYVVKQGSKYLCQQKTLTHTGTHIFESWTEDLNKATVFYDPRKSTCSAIRKLSRLWKQGQ